LLPASLPAVAPLAPPDAAGADCDDDALLLPLLLAPPADVPDEEDDVGKGFSAVVAMVVLESGS
jgi:hypothetical protein